MSRTARIALPLAGVVVMVAAFVALRPSSDDDAADRGAPRQSETTSTGALERGASGRPRQRDEEPSAPLGAGDPQTIKVTKGETVRFSARSERDDEVHVHGYDITREAPAGRTVSLSFTADIEGIFEIELEEAGEKIGDLEVRP